MLAGNPKLFSILVPLLQPVLGSGVQPAAPAASDAAPAPRRQLRARSKAEYELSTYKRLTVGAAGICLRPLIQQVRIKRQNSCRCNRLDGKISSFFSLFSAMVFFINKKIFRQPVTY